MTPAAAVWLLGMAAEAAAFELAVVQAWRGCRIPDRLPFGERVAKAASESARPPLVRLLAAGLAIDLAVAAIGLAIDGVPRPLHGWRRAMYHLADGLVMAWPCALAWAAVKVFGPWVKARGDRDGFAANSHGRTENTAGFPWEKPSAYRTSARSTPDVERRPFPFLRILAAVHAGASLLLALAYPLPRAHVQRVLLGVELAAVAVAWRAVCRGRREPWRLPHRTLLLLVWTETMIASVGPFARDAFKAWAVIGAGVYGAAFAGVAMLLARGLRGSRANL